MTNFAFPQVRSVLCLGAHSDDIEIGCGGTVLRLLSESDVDVHWVVFSGDQTRRFEAQQSADEFLRDAKSKQCICHDFRDGYFPSQWASIKTCMSELAAQVDPDLIFTHRLSDRHQDHKTVAELTWNHFRHHLILEFEVPKYEGDLETPNFYVGLSDWVCQRKVNILGQMFVSQRSKPWFDADAFLALLRLRGLESGLDTKFAEGFHVRKLAV